MDRPEEHNTHISSTTPDSNNIRHNLLLSVTLIAFIFVHILSFNNEPTVRASRLMHLFINEEMNRDCVSLFMFNTAVRTLKTTKHVRAGWKKILNFSIFIDLIFMNQYQFNSQSMVFSVDE